MSKQAETGAALGAPHRGIVTQDERERFTLELFDGLWATYRQRVGFVQTYEQVIAAASATFVNDHIAFRTLGCQQPATGIATLARLFEALGYVAAGNYAFPDKHLGSIHYQHANPAFPKLFISELKTWELSPTARQIIGRAVRSHRPLPSDETLAALRRVEDQSADERQRLLRQVMSFFAQLPWDRPEKEAVAQLNAESQFGAWVLVHGYNVNHFTALVNSHQADSLADIDKTVAALQQAGVPMKTEIEGAPGTKLRQTATEAVVLNVNVMDKGRPATIPWTYAYFEIAERNLVTDPQTGQEARFEGFLGAQATQLFEMTRVK